MSGAQVKCITCKFMGGRLSARCVFEYDTNPFWDHFKGRQKQQTSRDATLSLGQNEHETSKLSEISAELIKR